MSLPRMTFKPTPVPAAPNLNSPSAATNSQPKTIDQVADALKKAFQNSSVLSVEKSHKGDPYVVVNADNLFEVIGFLRDDAAFQCQLLQCISATDFLPLKAGETAPGASTPLEKDTDGRIEVLYALWSFTHRHQILVKVCLGRENPKIKSICDFYRAANWYERECWDLLGVIFEGHPDHQRILLPPDWVGHPLRKDYVFPQEYNGMKVPL